MGWVAEDGRRGQQSQPLWSALPGKTFDVIEAAETIGKKHGRIESCSSDLDYACIGLCFFFYLYVTLIFRTTSATYLFPSSPTPAATTFSSSPSILFLMMKQETWKWEGFTTLKWKNKISFKSNRIAVMLSFILCLKMHFSSCRNDLRVQSFAYMAYFL